MNKKLFSALVILAVAITGCDNQSDISDVKEETTITESVAEETVDDMVEEISEETEEVTDIKYADLIPDPAIIFPNSDISIIDADGGKMYFFQVKNYEKEEYDAYVTGCKEMGFTSVSYEFETDGGKMFGAYTENGEYWVETMIGYDSEIIAVTCKTATKNK